MEPRIRELSPAQWQLMLRAFHANEAHTIGPGAAQVSAWMHVSGASSGDVTGLHRAGFVDAVYAGESTPMVFQLGRPVGGYAVVLVHSRGTDAARRLDTAHTLLIYLSHHDKRGIPLNSIGGLDADRWGALVTLNNDGLVAARRLSGEGDVVLADLNLSSPRVLRHLMIRITAQGRRYAHRWDT